MEHLLALYNIKIVFFNDNANQLRYFAYTNEMAERDIFIEFFTVSDINVEEDLSEDELTEDERMALVDEEESEPEDEPEYGSKLSVITQQDGAYYEFLMFHNTVDLSYSVLLAQTIIFIVSVIEKSSKDQLLQNLFELAFAPLAPAEIKNDKRFRDVAEKMIETKLETVRQLIHDDRAKHN